MLQRGPRAMRNSTVSLLEIRLNSCIWALSTRFSARVLILFTRSMNNRTRSSVISVSRHQHNTANSVIATSGVWSRRSVDWNSANTRAFHTAIRASATSANRSDGNPTARTRCNLPISISSVSNPSLPGSAFKSVNRLR